MNEVNILRAQYIGVAISLVFLFFIIELIRKRHLKESHAIIWLFFGVLLLVLSLWREALDKTSFFLGIAYPPALLFIVLILGLLLVMIQYSIVITKLSLRLNRLTQEMGIIKAEWERSRKDQ